MANKKLKVEVELDTAKAKRQAKELESTGSGGASVSTVSPSADRASRQIRDLGRAAEGTQVNMKAAGKAFAGVAVGLAASYASKNMRPGAARDAVDYGGSALSGAAMGMMFGPLGAAIGGLTGVLKTYIDKSSERENMSKDFEKSERIFAAEQAKKERFDSLTDVKPSQYDDSISGLKSDYENYAKSTAEFVKRIREELQKASPDTELIEDLKRNVSYNRSQMEKYKNAIKQMEKAKEKSFDPRASIDGTDALQKIGLGGPAAEAVAATVASVSSTRAGRGSGFSVPEQSYQETKFGNFEKPNNDFKIITPLESAERNGRMSLETLRNIYQAILNKNGGVAWQ